MNKTPNSEKAKSKGRKPYQTSFTVLMQMYAVNFKYLNLLFDTHNLEHDFVLKSYETTAHIYISNITNNRYSTTFTMSYIFAEPQEQIPNVKIKLYKDTRQAEVLSVVNFHQIKSFHTLTRFDKLTNINAKWELNNFLNRWLRYCLDNRYRSVKNL